MTSQSTASCWSVYLLRCQNGRIYTGITNNLAARFAKHVSGSGAKFTKANPPSHIIAAKLCDNRSEASKLEYQIKQMPRVDKLKLAASWPKIKDLPKGTPNG